MAKESINAAVGDLFSEVESYDRLINSAIVNLLLKTNGGRGRGRKPNFVGGGRDRKPNFVACCASVVAGWVVVS